MVFNVLARNCDDHTKNFGFTMSPSGAWSLSPAYDVCHAYRPSSTWVSKHCLSINGKRGRIEHADFLEVARKMNIKGAREIVDTVDQVVGRWRTYADQYKVDPALRDGIEKTLLSSYLR
jgi:serine/threonine-protein kinase HipA